MSTIAIAVNGEPLFNWEGDEAAAQHILEAFPQGARASGQVPRQLADACVAYLSQGSLLAAGPVGQEFQMMGVIWHILNADTCNPEHPGKIVNYVGSVDFAVDLEIGEKKFTAYIEATSKFDA
jgi:hypothetical protein